MIGKKIALCLGLVAFSDVGTLAYAVQAETPAPQATEAQAHDDAALEREWQEYDEFYSRLSDEEKAVEDEANAEWAEDEAAMEEGTGALLDNAPEAALRPNRGGRGRGGRGYGRGGRGGGNRWVRPGRPGRPGWNRPRPGWRRGPGWYNPGWRRGPVWPVPVPVPVPGPGYYAGVCYARDVQGVTFSASGRRSINNLQNRALNKCQRSSNHPSTCRLAGCR